MPLSLYLGLLSDAFVYSGPRTGFIASIAYYIAKDPWKLWSDGSISNINCVMVVFSVLAILHWWSTMFVRYNERV